MSIPELTSQFGTDLNEIPDPNTNYKINEYDYSFGFTHLMKLVLCTGTYPQALDMIKLLLASSQSIMSDDTLATNINNIDARNSMGYTALHLASMYSNTVSTISTVKLLIDSNADLDTQNYYGHTALHHATQLSQSTSNNQTVKLLIDADSDVHMLDDHDRDAFAIVFSPNEEINIEVMKLLLDANADPNIRCCDKLTGLHYASGYYESCANIDAVQILIDAGANVNIRGECGLTPIMYAANCNNDAIVKLLIDSNANVSISNNIGLTPMFYGQNNQSIVKLLVDANADPDVKCKGKTGFNSWEPIKLCDSPQIMFYNMSYNPNMWRDGMQGLRFAN